MLFRNNFRFCYLSLWLFSGLHCILAWICTFFTFQLDDARIVYPPSTPFCESCWTCTCTWWLLWYLIQGDVRSGPETCGLGDRKNEKSLKTKRPSKLIGRRASCTGTDQCDGVHGMKSVCEVSRSGKQRLAGFPSRPLMTTADQQSPPRPTANWFVTRFDAHQRNANDASASWSSMIVGLLERLLLFCRVVLYASILLRVWSACKSLVTTARTFLTSSPLAW